MSLHMDSLIEVVNKWFHDKIKKNCQKKRKNNMQHIFKNQTINNDNEQYHIFLFHFITTSLYV